MLWIYETNWREPVVLYYNKQTGKDCNKINIIIHAKSFESFCKIPEQLLTHSTMGCAYLKDDRETLEKTLPETDVILRAGDTSMQVSKRELVKEIKEILCIV